MTHRYAVHYTPDSGFGLEEVFEFEYKDEAYAKCKELGKTGYACVVDGKVGDGTKLLECY